MKHVVYALAVAILALAGCATPDDGHPRERVELQPGYWDPR